MEKEKLIKKLEEHAAEKGIKFNPNQTVVDSIVDRLLVREKELGEQYCPCRMPSGNREEDKKIICPCVFHLDEIREDGHCHCLLFVKGD